MKHHTLIIILIFLSINVFGQLNVLKFNTPVSPSPTAASLGKYGDIPTENYTGVPKIAVPIYSVKIGSNEIPIDLNYHAGGFKVSEEASWVGLGWSLNAGGVITRTKKAIDDLTDKGYFKSSDHKTIGDGSDKEQDMFYYNFLGYTGKFVIDYSDNIQRYTIRVIGCYNEDNLKISLTSNNSWTITDKYGTIYQFGITEMTNDKMTSQGTYSGTSNTTNFLSSWFLNKIIYPTGQEVNLNYSDGPQVEVLPQIDQIFMRKNGATSAIPTTCYQVPYSDAYGSDLTTTTHTLTIGTKILSEIVFPGGKLKFNSTQDRIDLKCSSGSMPRLSSIELQAQTDLGYSTLKTFQFRQSYFSSSDREGYFSKRLKLDQLSQLSNEQSSKYKFTYNNISLPDKDSFNIDHWGYYNGPRNNTTLLPPSAYRKPDPTYVQSCLLSYITYPTNGSTGFTYEINDFANLGTNLDWTTNTSDNSGVMGAGVRIKKISNTKSISVAGEDYLYSEKEYLYKKSVNGTGSSSGQIMSKINYSVPYQRVELIPLVLSGQCAQYHSTTVRYNGFYDYSNSSIPISGDAQGNVIGYDNVIIRNNGLNNINNVTEEIYNNVSEASLAIYPLTPVKNNNLNGLIKSRILYVNKNGINSPLKRTDYEYGTQISTAMPNYIIISTTSGNGLLTYNVISDWITLNKITEKEFYPSLDTGSVSKTSNFTYNSSNRQISQESSSNSKNETFVKNLIYPSDMVLQGVNDPYLSMEQRNMIAYVVQEHRYKGSLLLSKIYTDYSANWPSNPYLVLPVRIRSQFMSNSPETRLNYSAYDSKGNPLSMSYEKGVLTSFLWSYNNSHLIAEVKNASFDDLAGILGNSNIVSFGNLQNPSNAAIDSFLAPLRSSANNIKIKTYYFQPLVGLKGQKDEKGMSTFFEYDDLQRLILIKDNDLNILKNFKYHFYEGPGPIVISK